MNRKIISVKGIISICTIVIAETSKYSATIPEMKIDNAKETSKGTIKITTYFTNLAKEISDLP